MGMRISTIIIGIILFAIATMIIYVWGLSRQRNQSKDLMNLLYSNGVDRVKKYLKKNGRITREEMEDLVWNMKAKMPFSTAKAVVTDEKNFCDELIKYMIKTGQIKKEGRYYKKA